MNADKKKSFWVAQRTRAGWSAAAGAYHEKKWMFFYMSPASYKNNPLFFT